MTNNETLKKKIIYRSKHRGTKEMDILLGNFVKSYIDKCNESDLKDLEQLLLLEDEAIYNWFFKKNSDNIMPKNRTSLMLKKFKI